MVRSIEKEIGDIFRYWLYFSKNSLLAILDGCVRRYVLPYTYMSQNSTIV